jgi:hypothetical protein
MSFLTAEWRKLAFANYQIDPKILQPHVPYGTELDLWEGQCYVSLVGFMFVNVRLLGIKIPFHVNFEEVNLRFYVRRLDAGKWKRGVVFIKEIVPKPAITFVANTIYGENYETMKMRHEWTEGTDNRQVSYEWKLRDQWYRFSLKADKAPVAAPVGGETEFITEHYWGYAHAGPTRTNEYEVTHPRWEHYPVQNYEIEADFGKLYGPEFEFLNQATPSSVMLAEGSAITIESKRVIS